MVQNDPKWSNIVQNRPKSSKMIQNVSNIPNSSKLVRMGQDWSGRGACFQKTTTLQRLKYFIQNPLPLLAMFFQNPLDNLHYYTIVINFSKQNFSVENM